MMRDTLQDRGGAGKSWLVRGAEPGGLLRLSGGHWGSRAFVEMAGTEELQEASSVDLVRGEGEVWTCAKTTSALQSTRVLRGCANSTTWR
eukprot:1137403-Pelagomonas_calceolata.AAC.2